MLMTSSGHYQLYGAGFLLLDSVVETKKWLRIELVVAQESWVKDTIKPKLTFADNFRRKTTP